MALNPASDARVVAFYRSVFNIVDREIQANAQHSLLVKELARQHPDICLVDTHPRLDGENEKFVDLIHLTQEGRRQLAENMFSGIRDALERDLQKGAPNAGLQPEPSCQLAAKGASSRDGIP